MILNWNTDEAKMKKRDPEGYKKWRLVQAISYGLWGEKLDKKMVVKYWPQIKDQLDIDGRKALEFFLWGKKWQKEPGLRPDRSNYLAWLQKKNMSKAASI
jgi:hypothetical protein